LRRDDTTQPRISDFAVNTPNIILLEKKEEEGKKKKRKKKDVNSFRNLDQ
jgi:hypothetical protein